MQWERICELGPQAFAAGMRARVRSPRIDADTVLGALDTECVSRTGRFLCAQVVVSGNRRVELLTGKPSYELLHRTALDLGHRDRGNVALACWFSVADIRHFRPWEEGHAFFVGPRGSLDVEYETPWGRLRLWDLQRYYLSLGILSLAGVARYYGLRKKDTNRAAVGPRALESRAFRAYARHDARITLAVAERTREGLSAQYVDLLVEKTAAAAASTIYRSFYLKQDVDAPAARIRALALQAAWGGRAEAFARGVFPRVHEWDYASAYPRACRALRRFPRASDWRPAETIDDFERGLGGLGQVVFDFGDARYPCLPIASEALLLFPSSGVSCCTGAEIVAARKLGAGMTLIEGYWFDDGDESLADYMAAMMKWRATAKDEAERAVSKLCANALTGKLIQNKGGLHVRKILDTLARLNMTWQEAGELSDEMWTSLGLDSPARCGSAWAPEWYALVTGHVRARLALDIERTRPLYVSTDSLWAESFPNRPDDVSDKGCGTALVLRSRLALLTDAQGAILHAARHSAHRPLEPAAYLRLLQGRKVKCVYRRPIMPRESLRYGKPLGKFHPVEVEVSAEWDRKRRLLADGTTTVPWKSVEEFAHESDEG